MMERRNNKHGVNDEDDFLEIDRLPVTKDDNINEDDENITGPEELVRRETKALMFLRVILIAVLIIVGGVLSFGTYKFGSSNEEKAYRNDFEAVSIRFTESFKSVLIQSMWNAYSIGVSISSNNALAAAAPNFIIPNFVDLTKGAMQTGRVPSIFWAPLIHDAKERLEWESYAKEQIVALTGSTSSGPCHVCGSESLVVGAANVNVELPIGTYTCGQIEWAGQSGVITADNCRFILPYVQNNCKCQPKRPSSQQSANQPNVTSTQPSPTQVPGQIVTLDFYSHEHSPVAVDHPGPFLPIWQVSPSAYWSQLAMRDFLSNDLYRGAVQAMMRTKRTIISESSTNNQTASFLFSPVFETPGNNSSRIIGSIIFSVSWADFLGSIVPLGSKGLDVVLENSCGQKRTFRSTGDILEFVGFGDQHDPSYSLQVKQTSFEDYYGSQSWSSPYNTGKSSHLNCAYRISVYASNEYRSKYVTGRPRLYAIAVILIFVFTCTVFITYDCYVARRQRKVMTAALQRDEIVSSLFPDAVRGRLLQRGHQTTERRVGRWKKLVRMTNPSAQHQLRNFPSSTNDDASSCITNPLTTNGSIADFFPCVTVVFADISGFTAWSSDHEPSEVFHLLETVYQTFDKIAKRYGVFKIETIGDCYVAVAGLPSYQPDHAVRIVKFAYECIIHMQTLIRELEATLGPSTSNLSIRIGAHSGPVIAGVLRGEKSRFQLFGDTMNTTSRVQTTGELNKIQISTATAKLLEEAKKSDWIQPRDDLVAMKGKGLVQTYWVDVDMIGAEVDEPCGKEPIPEYSVAKIWNYSPHPHHQLIIEMMASWPKDKRIEILVEANTDLLMDFLKMLVAKRSQNLTGQNPTGPGIAIDLRRMHKNDDDDEDVRSQLRHYIATIADSYHRKDTKFRTFEHASHVAWSAAEMLRSIKLNASTSGHDRRSNHRRRPLFDRNPSSKVITDGTDQHNTRNDTIGFNDDPLMQFSIVVFAIIHDVDPPDVSDQTETTNDCSDGKVTLRPSEFLILDPNPIDFAWALLKKEQYKKLLQCICGGDSREQLRFHQMLQNAMVAADVTPNDQMKLWDSGSSLVPMESAAVPKCVKEGSSKRGGASTEQKAAVVFESIVRASQLVHYMQDWNTFKFWSERMLQERYLELNRSSVCSLQVLDPSTDWYEKEILLFDHSVVPLVKQLERCGVAASIATTLLTFVNENRQKWAVYGADLVRATVHNARFCVSSG